jgi:hypothetical protein
MPVRVAEPSNVLNRALKATACSADKQSERPTEMSPTCGMQYAFAQALSCTA